MSCACGGKETAAKLQAQATISRAEAERIALAKVANGTIKAPSQTVLFLSGYT